jgi:hypothetical protein
MSNISVTTTQSVIDVTQTSGITVVTPTGQTIAVEVPNSSVSVTNTTDDITVLTNGTLNITTGITDRLVAGSNQVILNTNATMTFPNNVIDFGSQTADLKSSSYSELWYRNANPTPTAGQGIQTYIWSWENQAGIAVESVDNGYKEWYFNANGTTQFPNYTFPAADGTASQVLTTNGSGVLAWTTLNPTTTLTTSTTAVNQVVDSFAAATYRTAKYLVSITSGSAYQAVEILVTHNGTTAYQTVYADIATGANLAAFTVDITGGLVRLLTTPVNAVTVYRVTKTTLVV